MNYNSIIISMILSIIFFDVLGNNKLEMKCTITEELEKNEPAINKDYTEKDILIFIDRVNLWVSDIPYKKWKNQNKESVGKIEKKYEETEKIIYFNFYEFFEDKKDKLELSFKITIEKFGGYLSFIKFYHDHTGKVFFSSEIRGQCFAKK